MGNIPSILKNLRIPVIGSPLFIISNPNLVIEQCKAGIVGSMPALNARPASQLDEWIAEITEELEDYNIKAAKASLSRFESPAKGVLADDSGDHELGEIVFPARFRAYP